MKRVINFWSLTGAISAAVFISVEIAIVAAAAVWAISSLLSLGTAATTILAVLVVAPSLYGVIRICILAFLSETDPENN